MRPIRLEVEGFTCYRERQQPLDFSSLSLFAIAGPTGAGKSSILDTMLYALYGEVPRIGKHGIGEFVSHGRDAMSVCLDYRVSGKDFRVTRRVKRVANGNLKTTVTLAEVVGGLERSLADGVKPVNEKIVGLLGLGYEEFIQTVVLPQGDFAKFLKAKPTEQRAILQHLLRHDVFTRMRDVAEERRKALTGRVEVIDGKLSTYAEATPEALAAQETLLADALAQVETATAARDDAEAAAREARERHALTKEVVQLREQRHGLEQHAPAVERARVDLDRARRAGPVLPRIVAVVEASVRAEKAGRAGDEAEKSVEQALAGRKQAATRAAAATTAVQECDALERRVRALDEIAGDIVRRTELGTALAALPAGLASAEAETKTARKGETAAGRKAEQAHATLQELKFAHDAVAFDDLLHTQVEAALPEVGEARALARELATLASDTEDVINARVTAQRELDVAEVAHEAARVQAETAARDAEKARATLEEARVRHAAADLRAHLHAGDLCPVCLQAVDQLPMVKASSELTEIEKAARDAAEREKKTEGKRQAASNTLATSMARLRAAVTVADAVEGKRQSRTIALNDLLMKVAAAAPAASAGIPSSDFVQGAASRGGRASAAVLSPGTALLDWIEQRHRELRAARDERARQAQALHRAAMDLSEAQLTLVRAEGDAKAAVARHQQLVVEHDRLQADLAVVLARIHAVTTSDDPQAERRSLTGRVGQLREAERASREAMAQADLQVLTATERLRAAESALSQATADVASTRELLATILAEAGFATADEVEAAMRTPSQQAALHTEVTRFDQQRAGIVHRLAELDPLVAGREVSAEALADAERRRKAAVDAWQAASQQVTALANDVARLQKDLKVRAALVAEREALQATLAVTTEMATDLRGDRFQEYLLEEAFTALVAGASVRMRDISNRYTLEWEESEFYVVDHDNAGERRRADTLSGGETFMASLCLALQLSETVLQASGALQMDSLFIDEGFGTLDIDSLSEVTDAIEALGQHGDRLIGVISHRAELTDRLPGLIRVDKGMGESRWVVERVG